MIRLGETQKLEVVKIVDFGVYLAENAMDTENKVLLPAKQVPQGAQIGQEIEVSDEKTAINIMRLLNKLEEHDDVQNVYSNFDISDELMEKIDV